MSNRYCTARSASLRVAALTIVGYGIAASPAAADAVSNQVVILSTDPVPGGNGTFSEFRYYTLNDAGQVFLTAQLKDTAGEHTDDQVGYVAAESGLVQIVREGQPAPDGNGKFLGFFNPALNASGQVAFSAILTSTSFGSSAIYRADGSTLLQIARRGEHGGGGPESTYPALNQAGQLAFLYQDNVLRHIVRSDGQALQNIAGPVQPAPGGGNFSTLGHPFLNDIGQVAFRANVTVSTPGRSDNEGLFRGDGQELIQIAREGQLAPDGNGSFGLAGPADPFFFAFRDPALNNVGQAAFRARLVDTSGGNDDNEGVFRGDGAMTIQVARRGQPAPGGGVFSSFWNPLLNNAGQTAFLANISNVSGGPVEGNGIYRGGDDTLIPIAHTGQPAPDGRGIFSAISSVSRLGLNDAGQVAFLATLSDNTVGLFLFDDTFGLLTIARGSDALLGSVITAVRFNEQSSIADYDRSSTRGSLNQSGEIVYQFFLADGRTGIAIATPPDLSSLTPGDSDFDGDVDLSDLGTLATMYGQSSPAFGWVNGDFDNDNDVDLNDLGVLASNYGNGQQAAFADFAALTSVPEPAAAGLLALAGMLALRPRALRRE